MNDKHITGEQLQDFLQGRRFGELFAKLGWDCEGLLPIPPLKVGDKTLTATPVAEKREFVVCVCDDGENLLASKAERKRIAAQLSRYHYEHLLIVCNEGRQRWMLAIRPQDRPMQTAEVEWHHHQTPRALADKLKGLFFHITDEEKLYLSDVVEKVRGAFLQNHEAVTQRFYSEFQAELKRFAGFIEGICEQVQKELYAALTLNRLMFIYFLQKRGFLDNNINYLVCKLKETQDKYGKDKFERVFYRKFLRRLFAEGLNAPETERPSELVKMLGKVPYLDGGLFDLHEIEKSNPKLDIPDVAFECIFAFFDKYQWHLDTRPQVAGNEINPDIIGYIFEQYINDRAKMGAYYTQEDVTGYIARNSIIPFLLERARAQCANAFDAQNGIWRFLREEPQNYIHKAVQKGCNIPDSQLPPNIRKGLDAKKPNLNERRAEWNTQASEPFALPGETWRETIARRIRCQKLINKMQRGEVCTTADLITDNLDIERFAADAIDYEGADFADAFFAAIAGKPSQSDNQTKRGISIMDPACGSGAFLFAALNVLEPLYQKCLNRMEVFVDEDDTLRAQQKRKGKKMHPHFRKTLADIKTHANEQYWIYKQIILNNLYGVDMMREAAEVAKLRLFLKLAAAAGDADPTKPNLGLEPLPDIDFNIRSGNSLVGYASMKQFDELTSRELLDKKTADDVRKQMALVQKADAHFRQSQNEEPKKYRKAKRKLDEQLHALNKELDKYLAKQYGKTIKTSIKEWTKSHRPFHWLANFHNIIENRGGFDVVIGNPPYVEYNKVKNDYTVRNYRTEKCNDLYALFIERNVTLLNPQGHTAMIVPLSLGVSQNKKPCRDLLFDNYSTNWFSSFGRIPAGLFPSDVRVRNTIHIGNRDTDDEKSFTTRLHRWKQEARFALFNTMEYSIFSPSAWKTIPKLNTPAVVDAFERILANAKSINKSVVRQITKHPLYYKTNAYNWLAFSRKPIPCYKGDTPIEHTSTKILYFCDAETRDIAMLLANGKIAMSYWLATGDDFTVAAAFLRDFPCDLSDISAKDRKTLLALMPKLEKAMNRALQFKLNAGVHAGNFNLAKCRHITDKSDALFAKILGIDEVALADIDLYQSQAIKTDFNTE